MPAPTPSVLLTDRASIEELLSAVGATLADTDADSDQPADIAARMSTAVNVGSATVLRYCQPIYDGSELVKSASAWEWGTVMGCCRLWRRRSNPLPDALEEMRAEAMEELKAVLAGALKIEDIDQRAPDGPMWSTQTLNPLYRNHQARVQRRMGEQTPRAVPPATDWPGEYFAAEEPFGG